MEEVDRVLGGFCVSCTNLWTLICRSSKWSRRQTVFGLHFKRTWVPGELFYWNHIRALVIPQIYLRKETYAIKVSAVMGMEPSYALCHWNAAEKWYNSDCFCIDWTCFVFDQAKGSVWESRWQRWNCSSSSAASCSHFPSNFLKLKMHQTWPADSASLYLHILSKSFLSRDDLLTGTPCRLTRCNNEGRRYLWSILYILCPL